MELDKDEKIELIKEAFVSDSSAYDYCECGRLWVDTTTECQLEEHETEMIKNEDKAGNEFFFDGSIGLVRFSGNNFVYQCDCWHDKGINFANGLLSHRRSIRSFFIAHKKLVEDELKYGTVDMPSEQLANQGG